MKKNLIAIFAFLFVMGLFAAPSYADDEKNVLKTDEKEAVMIDDTKMQDVSDMPTEKEIKKFKKEQEKLNKEKLKEEEKELKKQQKEQEKLQKEQLKEEKANAAKEEGKDEVANEAEKQEAKQEEAKNETKKELQKEAKKEEIKVEEEKEPVVDAAAKKEDAEAKEAELKTIEDVKKEEPVEIKGETTTDEAKLHENKQEATEEKTPAQLYRKNLTYEDVEKNAVSVNEFLQFTDKQNEKFSLFYYKTTAKLNDLTRQIKNKEQEMVMVKRSKIAVKEQLKKLKKLDEEKFALYKERDDYYNKALDKFNSMLNKKQQIKWEILQEMGYRFFPEFE